MSASERPLWEQLGMSVADVGALSEPIPAWFLNGPWSRVPRGWRRSALPYVPNRYVELSTDLDDRLMMIVSGHTYGDGKRWLHVSVSRPARMPGWLDMCRVKDEFIGPEYVALQVHPRTSEYVNFHETCLHLWHCIDGDVTPDFRRKGTV